MKVAMPELMRATLDGRLPAAVEVAWYRTLDEVAPAARGADVLVAGFIDGGEIRASIEAAPDARWVSSHAAGVDHYPMDLLRARGLLLTKGSGIGAAPIAEFIVLCVLSAAKGFPYYLASSARGEWPTQRPSATELDGSTALIVGYGAIGRAAGQRLASLGVAVTGVRRHPADESNVLASTEWKDRLSEFDWVALTAALTPETRFLIGRDELARMKPTSWLINIARGGLIDQDALVEALHAGRPRGAYLDVTEPEPLPADHALWSAPNLYITGHSSGRGDRSLQRYATLFLHNLAQFQAGRPLTNVVDLTAGY